MINKIVFRSLRKNKKLFFAISILFMLASMLVAMTDLSFNNLDKSNQEYKQSSNREDFRFYPITSLKNINLHGYDLYNDELIDQIAEDNDLEIEYESMHRVEVDDYALDVHKYNKDQKLDKLTLSQGHLPQKANELVMTQKLFDDRNFLLGDTIEFDNHTYEIVGTVYSPEYTFALDLYNDSAYKMPQPGKFGAVFVYPDSYVNQKESGYYRAKLKGIISEKREKKVRKKIANDYTQAIPTVDENGDVQVNALGVPVTTDVKIFPVVLDDLMNPSLTAIDMEISNDQASFATIGLIITLLAIALTVVLMQTIFKSQSREMGILKAEGILNSQLGFSYLMYLTIALLISQIVGIILASFVAPAFVEQLLVYYSLPIEANKVAVYTPVVIKGLLILFTVLVVVYWFAIRKQLNQRPLLLIKNISTDKPPKINISKFTKRMSFTRKYQINILIRNFSKTLLLAFGILVSSFLLLFAALTLDAVNKMTDIFENGTMTYEYVATYDSYKPEISNNTIIKKDTKIKNKDETVINLFAYDYATDYLHLEDENGNLITKDQLKGAVITSQVASSADLEVGDTFKFTNPYQQNEYQKLTVTAIVKDPINNYVYSDLSSLQKLLGVSSKTVNGEMGVDKTKDEVLKQDEYATYVEVSDISKQLDDQMVIVWMIIGIMGAIASIIAIVTLVTITIIIINSNRKTISVMKVLGYTNKEIKRIITSPYRIILILIYFSSIPLIQNMINALLKKAFGSSDFAFEVKINLYFALMGFIVIYVVYEFSMFIAYRVIKKIKLSESLKMDE